MTQLPIGTVLFVLKGTPVPLGWVECTGEAGTVRLMENDNVALGRSASSGDPLHNHVVTLPGLVAIQRVRVLTEAQQDLADLLAYWSKHNKKGPGQNDNPPHP